MQVEQAESNASTAGISGDKSRVKGTLQNAAGAVKIQSTTIKGYADDAIKKGHVFSEKHVKKGIMLLATTAGATDAAKKDEILDKFKNIVKDINSKGLFNEGTNQIKTVINGLDVEIKVHIIDGIVKSLDGYIGHSSREWANSITWP